MLILPSAILILANVATAFPSYGSLAGLSREELDQIIPTLNYQAPPNPPGPPTDTSAKLVNDADHPWKPLGEDDIRGPCPGLNTLASHGYLPRSGIATPSQIIDAVQEGFNMEHGMAVFVTYAAHLVDGNLITDQLRIGRKSETAGSDAPSPDVAGALNAYGLFGGDACMIRSDSFFEKNQILNETLFQQFIDFSNRYGAGKYNLTVAAELRWHRIQESIATNPTFSFIAPRTFTAYAESTFPINFFVDGRQTDNQLDLDAARGFFKDNRMPNEFFRANSPRGSEGSDVLAAAHPIGPGSNLGSINNYVLDPTSANLNQFCLMYTNFVNQTILGLYPEPTGVLLKALNQNLDFFHSGIGDNCPQVFPYGKPQ